MSKEPVPIIYDDWNVGITFDKEWFVERGITDEKEQIEFGKYILNECINQTWNKVFEKFFKAESMDKFRLEFAQRHINVDGLLIRKNVWTKYKREDVYNE